MKYNWKQLEKDYIKSNYLSIKYFLKDNNIKYIFYDRKKKKEQKKKKNQRDIQKSSKITEKLIKKLIEKESEKETNKIIKQKYNKKNVKNNSIIDNLLNDNGLVNIHNLKIITRDLKKDIKKHSLKNHY